MPGGQSRTNDTQIFRLLFSSPRAKDRTFPPAIAASCYDAAGPIAARTRPPTGRSPGGLAPLTAASLVVRRELAAGYMERIP